MSKEFTPPKRDAWDLISNCYLNTTGLAYYHKKIVEYINKNSIVRQNNHLYNKDDIVRFNDVWIKCMLGGTTASTPPTLTTEEIGTTITDGGVTWTVVKYALTTDVPPLASALATPRKIGGVSFDGTADINLPGVNAAGNQDTTGNAATATKLATPRKIELTGNVTGSADFDGSKDIQIATTLVRGEGLTHLIPNNAGAHNAIYRGKNLGAAVTDAQWAAIKAGTFDDLFIGDYWTIGDVNWRIAAFDYWLHCGDARCTTHHVVIVPDMWLSVCPMNSTGDTTGGYVGSDFYTGSNSNTGKATAVSKINVAFGSSHILTHREALTNAVTDGKPTSVGWYNSTVELMSEAMIYGAHFFASSSLGNYTIDKTQLPLFAYDPSRIVIEGNNWWVRDVVSVSEFALVDGGGRCSHLDAWGKTGMRPAFGIK